IKFAVVKALGWSREKNYYVIDECFEYNVREAKRYGIKVGAYLFSYAYTDAQALEEADFFHNSEVMKRLRADGFKFDLPVFFDYEYTGSNGMGGIPANTSSNEQRTQILRTGMERLKSYGYYPGFYSGYNFTKRFLNGEQLIREGYDFWVADYRGSNAWGSSAVMWQYGGGSVNGIIGSVDMNELYKDYTGIIFGSGSGLPSVEISITVRDANNSNQIVTAPLTDILAQIVYNEIGNPKITGRDRDKAFRVQAIAAHSWLLYQQQNAGQDVAVAPIVGLKKNPPADIKQAVEAVKNSVLVYNGKPAMTMYSSSSGGVTNSAQDYFARSDFPYLTNVSANVGKWEEKAVSYGWEPYRNRSRTFNKTEMSQAIYKMGITPNSDLASWVSSVGKNPQSGYSTGVTVCGNWVKPATFYGNLYGLISPNFDFRYNGNETWTAYNINGNGHGVGMSQYALIGACGETEKTEIEILKTFYPNTELVIV
ncbi:MAG: SpoIID/LytB domain-containing protein, partial [Christensenella sp.]